MRYGWLIGGLLLAMAAVVQAETHYVRDIVQITLRTGPATDHKIIDMITSGERLEVLQEGDGWSRVRTEKGREGWVLTRLLTTEVPNSLKLVQLQEQLDALQTEGQAPLEQLESLQAKNLALENDLAALRFELDASRQAYQKLKKTAAGTMQTRKALKTAKERIVAQQTELDELNQQLSQELGWHYIRWFMAGGGVLLAGFIVGYVIQPKRRRSGLL